MQPRSQFALWIAGAILLLLLRQIVLPEHAQAMQPEARSLVQAPINSSDNAMNAATFPVVRSPRLILSSACGTRLKDGRFQITYTLRNTGAESAESLRLTLASLLGADGKALPLAVGPTTLTSGQTLTRTVAFPASARCSRPVLEVYGTQNGLPYSLSRTVFLR